MRGRLIAALATAAVVAVCAQNPLSAQQGQLPLPPGGFRPPPPAQVKPYQAVPVTPPPALNDPSFSAFRRQLGDIAAHRDRAALGKIAVAQNFFWVQDKNLADPHKSGIENLAKAIDLNAADDSGWEVLAGFANEASAAESPQRPGVFCAPADPNLDMNALEALAKATQTDPSEWGFPNDRGGEVPSAKQIYVLFVENLVITVIDKY